MIATSLSLDTTRTIHAQAEAANSSPLAHWLASPDWSCTHLCFNRSSAVLLDPTTSTRTFRTGSDLLTLSPSARLHETLIQARPTKNARLAHEQSIVSDRPGSHAGRPGIAVGICIPDGMLESRSWWAYQLWFMASRPLRPHDAYFKIGAGGVGVRGHASGWKRALRAAVPLLQPTSVAAAMPTPTVQTVRPLRTGRSRISQGGALIFCV